ncbi:copper resistance protein NlpE [Porphyromonas sp. COT-108 OH1349]|uniref:copper resistance protein NlpE n=1 Tax=Porphyromonas sp. COT-108 OH1349 TaxID=1537504 RepID=UPI00052BBCBD|nr:copper resistance protein NlpE [Porphyromonas sp. COT-108 OH1349]KGN69600.1 hypothetical protein JT26_05140 [Porphyromonas sp. COT-108 OH1349]
MKKRSLMIVLSAIFLVGCNNKSGNETATETTVEWSISEEAMAEVLKGTFEGVIPCADCEGIRMSLILSGEEFSLTMEYMGEENSTFQESGKFTLLENRRTIELSSPETETRYFNVYEDRAVLCDSNGVETEGELAQNYVLIKK